MTDEPYRMTLSLNVLNHLGINLYSSLPAVLSEVVANAWDADATSVSVNIDASVNRIVICDNGIGMTQNEANGRFLHVGYRRREDTSEGAGRLSPIHRRPVMGRKGLGKLSLFSIAGTVEIQSVARRPISSPDSTSSRIGFTMELSKIEDKIADEEARGSAGGTYHPIPLSVDEIQVEDGTQIVLTNLKRDASRTSEYLRRRLARRFSMTDENFKITLNGEEISAADRDATKLVNHIWLYGPSDYVARIKSGLDDHVLVEERESLANYRSELYGWIGSVSSTSVLKPADLGGESLNAISLFVRGKMAQEDVLRTTDSRAGLFTQYLLGELHADFLDSDDQPDIATSSRQSIVEDDPRFVALLTFLRQEIPAIGTSWNRARENEGEKQARNIASVDKWFQTLQGTDKTAARQFFGKINRIPADEASKRRLMTNGVIAFEGLRRRRRLDAIEQAEEQNLPLLIDALNSMDDIEAAAFYEIARDRIAIIQKFENLVDSDSRERVLHEYLFDHLWLLDPTWERTTTPVSEKTIRSIIDKRSGVDSEILASRVDIKYRKSEGVHVIVELKRASVKTSASQLYAQIEKYHDGVMSHLRATEGENVDLQIVCVIGQDLSDYTRVDGRKHAREMLGVLGARALRYEKLIEDAKAQYQDYLDRYKTLGPIREVLAAIEEDLDA